MNNRKIQDGELKIIELIDTLVDNENCFNYSKIKSKIEQEKEKNETETNQNKSSRYIYNCVTRYALSLCLCILSIISLLLTFNNKSTHTLPSNNELSEVLTNSLIEGDSKENDGKLLDSCSLYSLLLEMSESSNYLELQISYSNKNYFVAYLSNDIIKQIDNYFTDNDIFNTKEYHNYLLKINNSNHYNGYNDILVKYYYYAKHNNISIDTINSNIKWIEYEYNDLIKYNISNSSVIFVCHINDVITIKDLKTNTYFNTIFKVINELTFNINSDKEYIDINNITSYENRTYLYDTKNKNINNTYLSQSYLDNKCAEVVYKNNDTYVYGIKPYWYNFCNDNNAPDIYKDILVNYKSLYCVITSIKCYECFDEKIYNNSIQDYDIHTYYKYIDIINYLIS